MFKGYKTKSVKRILSVAVLSIMIAGAMTGCGEKKSEKNIVLKAGFSTSETDPRVEATKLFKEEVEAATDGRIQIEIHHSGEIGSDTELIDGIVNGVVDITASSAGNFANYGKNVGISAFPFLFSDFDEAWSFVDGDIEKKAEEELVANNIKVLGHYDNGFRCVTTSEAFGPIEKVEDMENLVIRTPGNRIVMQTMLTLGAKPEEFAFSELYDALKSGRFDAQENPIPVIYNNNLYEVQKNLAITNHSYDVMLFVIRDDIWNSLSEDDQKIILDAAKKAQDMDRKLIKTQTEEFVQKLEDAGMNITYPNLNDFNEATQSVFDELSSSYDKEIIDAVR